MKRKSLGWTPVRRGDVYCSPACGGGCTYHAYMTAKRLAATAAKAMGKGWKPDVWENLGWHWRVLSPCGRLKISGGGNSYIAFLGEANSAGGRWAEHGRTMKSAARNTIKVAKAELARLGAMLQGF